MTRSAEEVHEGLRYYCDDLVLGGVIVRTICRLPEDVQDFALSDCVFLSAGSCVNGMVLPGRIVAPDLSTMSEIVRNAPSDSDELFDYLEESDNRYQRWIVLLREDLPEGDEEGIVAHELAHAWLKHDCLSLVDSIAVETAAADLAREWGFKGIGTDVEYNIRPYIVDDEPRSIE